MGKNEPVSIADEVPFEIPESWEWVTLKTIATSELGKTLDKAKNTGDFHPYLCSINVYWDGIDLSTVKQARFEDSELPKYRLRRSDLLICEGGDVGRSAIWNSDQEMYYQNALHRVRFYGDVCPDFYLLVLECYKGNKILDEYSKGMTIKHLVQSSLNAIYMPLPPALEQIRIVEMISRIRPYLQKYDAAESSLNELNNGFPDQLKKSILQLAVQGKLVPQDPNDEPASVLLERIRSEKERLITEGKIKRDKNESVIYRRDNSHYEKRGKTEVCIDEEILFDTPKSWQWVRLSSVCSLITDGEHKTPQRVSSFQGYYLLSARNIRDGSLALDDVDYVDATEYENISKRCNPQRNDILISCSGSVGRVCRVEDNNNYVMVRSAAMVSPILVNSEFLMYSLQSGIVQTQIKEKTKQTAQANLFQGAIRELLLPVPPVNEQNRICEAIVPLLKLCKFSL